MNLYRCTICGEVYAGDEKPTHCPFCGAHVAFLPFAENWKEMNRGVEVSEESKKYLEKTLELEIHASRLYRGVSKKSESTEVQSLFKYLAKVEMEHAEVASKLLGISLPEETLGMDDPFSTDKENIEESLRLEEEAVKIYGEFLQKSVEPRLKVFFGALIAIERDHAVKDKEELEKLI